MKSFRGIGDLTLDLSKNEPTVIIGVNGVGKSSILDCLAILFSWLIVPIKNSFESTRPFSKQDITNGSETTNNEITISLDGLQEFKFSLAKMREESIEKQTFLSSFWLPSKLDIVESFRQGLLSENEYKEAKKALSDRLVHFMEDVAENAAEDAVKRVLEDGKLQEFLSSDNLNFFVQYFWQSHLDLTRSSVVEAVNDFILFKELQSLFELQSYELNIPLAVYYPVNRAVLDMPLEIVEEHSFKQTDAYEQALTGGKIDFKSFFEWFRNREDLENELRRDEPQERDRQLEAVRKAISSLMPDFSSLRVRRSPLRMTVIKQGQELIVNQLSDGEKCLLAMVGDLARRLAIANPSLSDPLNGSGIVLIDEIELHLHPKWQREIISALTRTFVNCQFIVTTHSPQVISHVKPENIYLLEKTLDGIVAKKPESSFGRDSNRILEDIMGVPERPQQIKNSLLELFQLIDEGNIDDARALRQRLAIEIGADEPEFVKADVLIRRQEILNR